jgi:hypothetical protein
MNCLDCHPGETPAVAVCGRCGAGQCAEHLVATDEYLTFLMVINRTVRAAAPARKLRWALCAAAEEAQQQHMSA